MLDTNEDKKFKALLSLLDEPDDRTFDKVRDKILSYGINAIPSLEKAWENTFEPIIQNRIENIIHQIQVENITKELNKWIELGYKDLLSCYILISRYHYPALDENKVREIIENLRSNIWVELNDDLTALEKIKILNHIVFDINKFHGSNESPDSVKNYFINDVLETKKGNSLSLGIIYLILSQNNGLPVYGVDLPETFILAYTEKDKILFYINPFKKGSLFTKREIGMYLKHLKIDTAESYYNPCNNLIIIKRLLYELASSYDKAGYPDKVREIKILIDTVEATI